jgi:dCTP deaminase
VTILSDRQIAALCTRPDHYANVAIGDTRKVFIDRGHYLCCVKTGEQFERLEQYGLSLIGDDHIDWQPMIEPFVEKQVREEQHRLSAEDGYLKKVISYGLTSFGYDVRLGRKFKIFTNINSTVIDPMAMSDDCYVDFEGDVCIIPPHSYALGHTIETFDLPKDVVAVCLGKSTYARAGCAINVTPIEPGFKGQVVLELANQTPLPMKVYANMGIAQFMFHRGEPCMVSYADRGGKYQGQQGVTTARV